MIPFELTQIPQWVIWRPVVLPTGKTTKLPYDPKSPTRLASVVAPETWGTFEQAKSSGERIGFVLTENDPYCFIDLDETQRESELTLQRQIFERVPGYAERSPSGKGLHIICRANLPNGRRRYNVEVYSAERYMTMTGDVYRDAPIVDAQETVSSLFEYLGGVSQTTNAEDGREERTDVEIHEIASNAANGERFVNLWRGAWREEGYPSQSEADHALVNILAFYTESKAQVRRMFLASALGQREKAKKHRSYVTNMIERSFDRKMPLVMLEQVQIDIEKALAPQVRIVESTPKDLPTNEDSGISRPPGLLGEIADFVYSTAHRPIREVALLGAIGLMAGVCGRAWNVSATGNDRGGEGLNQYLILIAESGVGKNAISSAYNSLGSHVQKALPASKTFFGPSLISSEQALRKQLNENPCFVSYTPEVGFLVKRLLSPRPDPASQALKAVFLALWSSSGKGSQLGSIVYSDREKNTAVLHSPSFTWLGETTGAAFWPALNDEVIREGFVPRLLTIEYKGDRPPPNPHAGQSPSDHLCARFAELCSHAIRLSAESRVQFVGMDPHATDLLGVMGEFNLYADDRIRGHSGPARDIWNRAHLKALKLAALVAVGENAFHPVISEYAAKWAIDVVKRDVEGVLSRLESGEIVTSDSEGQQVDQVLKIVREWITTPWDILRKVGFPPGFEAMHAQKIVPYAFVSRKLINHAVFRRDKNGSTFAIKRALRVITERGDLQAISAQQMLSTYSTGAEGYAIRNTQILV